GWVMKLAPLGIFALLAKLIATEDVTVLSRLAEFAVVVTGTTIFHGLVVLPLLLWLFGKMNPVTFFKGTRAALITAFATSSSSATMPVSMRCAEQNLGVNPGVVGFVVPLGSQMNMDGTALYEAAAALFIANGPAFRTGAQIAELQNVDVYPLLMQVAGVPALPSRGKLQATSSLLSDSAGQGR
ncbi:dicarboxylate/amino acid:cation symporter, partial [Undibacterium luofuense]|uniref:dicarboxylate/amino acid:cation symporter n=1 Tax=Undibacterium luofuense TaxID=2828733 RepID=UPI0030EB491C